MFTYTTINQNIWGKNRFNENEKLIIDILNIKLPNIMINKFTIYHYIGFGFIASPRFPIFNYWWVIDQKYPKLSKSKLRKVFINFIKISCLELKGMSNLNDKIAIINSLFQEKKINEQYLNIVKNIKINQC